MRSSFKKAALIMLFIVACSALTLAGTGLKVETIGSDEYVAAGIDLELGLPGIPVRPMTELIGWGATDSGQPAHAQAGVGARFYLDKASSGPFLEAKMRYVLPLEGSSSEASNVLLFGVGYRLRPVVGGLDLYISTTAAEHDLIPKYVLGGRIGF